MKGDRRRREDGTGSSGRLAREAKTIAAMFALYCAGHHGKHRGLCPACRDGLSYAQSRLAGCPYGEAKPVCRQCPIHCYRPAMREQMRKVMGWAGPRMFWRHPWLALLHLLDGRRRAIPPRPARSGGKRS